jgi:hypothetical protein
MPIKSANTAVAIPKKVIYVHWGEQEVYTEEEYRARIAELITERLEDNHILGDWITDNYAYDRIGEMLIDEGFREEVLEEYSDWCRRNAEEELEDEFTRFEV